MKLITRNPVATYTDLPIVDNMLGDCRKTIDTDNWYMWTSMNNNDDRSNWKLLAGDLDHLVDYDADFKAMIITK